MSVFRDYKCSDCEQILENKIQVMIHHVETKHQTYELLGSDYKMVVKS